MDVTRRYVRNFSKWGAERSRTPEPVLLWILDEIRATKRKNMSKQDKFRLEGEEMREYRELQGYVASAITAEICKIIPDRFFNGSSANNRTPRPDPDASKAAEARQNSAQAEVDRTRIRGPNGARGAPNPQHPQHPPPPPPR
jgi:peptide-N4-(N-acetyl-beta-glucosaminyl)asparagine amidase